MSEAVLLAFGKLLEWVKQTFPTVAFAAQAVYNFLLAKIMGLQSKLEQKELERKYLENANIVEAANKDKSDTDIVRDAIKQGRRKD